MIRIFTITGVAAILCCIAFAAVTPAVSFVNEKLDHRIALMRDIVKLSIVVMANQTPISSEEAKRVPFIVILTTAKLIKSKMPMITTAINKVIPLFFFILYPIK